MKGLEIYLIRKGWKSTWSGKVGNLLDQERFPAREVDFLHSSSPQHLKPSFCLLQQVHVKFCHWSLIFVCANQWNLPWHKKTHATKDAEQIYNLSHSKLPPCVLVWELRRWFKRYEGDKFWQPPPLLLRKVHIFRGKRGGCKFENIQMFINVFLLDSLLFWGI